MAESLVNAHAVGPGTNRWWLHRLVMEPLLPGAESERARRALREIARLGSLDSRSRHDREATGWRRGEAALLEFLERQGLTAFWHEMLKEKELEDEVSSEFFQALRRRRVGMTANYLMQRHHLDRLRGLFDEAGIVHLFFKGGHVRERIHGEPSLRDASDLDVLISSKDRARAVGLLVEQGYTLFANPKNLSHEVTLLGQGGVIDLHWDLLRPGRTRVPLADDFLATRKDFGSHWGPDDSAALFLLLVHPVFTKYVTTPQSPLMRALDLYWWLERVAVEWDEVLTWLDRAGLRTAAWITLRWLALFGDPQVPMAVWQKLRPGRLRSAWLEWWVAEDLSSRWLHRPWVVQGAFTLPAHDRVGDALRALRMRHLAGNRVMVEASVLDGKDHD